MRLIKFLIGVTVLAGCSPSDDSSPKPEDVFIKYFGESGEHIAKDMVFNESMNEYILLGSQDLGESNASDFYFVRADYEGNIMQEASTKDFTEILDDGANTESSLIDVPSKLYAIDGDRYLVVGTSSNTDEESRITWGVVDHDLEMGNATFFEISNSGQDLVAADIIKVSGQDYVIILGTATTLEPGDLTVASTAGQQFFLAKVGLNDGQIVWRRTMGVSGNDVALRVFETASGGFAVFGSTQQISGNHSGTNVRILITNAQGESDEGASGYGLDATTEIPNLNSYNDVPYDVYRVGNSYKVVGGSSLAGGSHKAFLMDISRQGDLSFATTLSNDYSLNAQAFTITRAFNGNYVIMGSYNSFEPNQTETGLDESRLEEAMVIQVDAFGNKIDGFDDYFGLESGNDRTVRALTLPTGEIVMLGTFDFGSGISLLGLIKLNSSGELK